MLNIAARVSAIGLAAGALSMAVAMAPAAQASAFKPPVTPPAKPVTQTTSFPTGFGSYSPCDGSLVATTGHGSATTITNGQRTTAVISDFESGDGYELIEIGTGTFSSLSSSYTIKGDITWIDLKHLAKSFHGPITATLSVSSSNAPESFNSTPTSLKCGL
jgi:hypothetical protein